MAKKKTEKEYLEKFNIIHNGKYQYKKFPEIFNQHTKITIICPNHGEFQQIICNHSNGMGCPYCGKQEMSNTKVKNNKKRENYKLQIINNYNNEFDFSNTNFEVPYDSKVKVICKKCGLEQEKRLSDLLRKKAGCSKCRIPKMQETFYQELRDIGRKEFLRRSAELYNNKYDYSNVEYKDSITPVKIICPIHGEFLQTPRRHLYGLEECPICRAESNYSKFEELVARYLEANNIKNIPQYRVKQNEYLSNKPFDFYIEEKNLLIEVDGPQHRECCWNMTIKDLEKRQEIDKEKTNQAIKEGFNILRLSTDEDIIKLLKQELDNYK